MQWPITNTCGHTYTYNINGPVKDRERKAEWLKTQTCPTCRYSRPRCECASAANGGVCTCC